MDRKLHNLDVGNDMEEKYSIVTDNVNNKAYDLE